jgi:hypothetical protein
MDSSPGSEPRISILEDELISGGKLYFVIRASLELIVII